MKQLDVCTEGYIDGFAATEVLLPERLHNRSPLYVHGWLNGRDDRTGKPRASAEFLRHLHQQLLDHDQEPFK